MKVKPVLTKDGSYTLYDPDTEQHYHSVHGARQESEHVFIRSGLEALSQLPCIRILELGFGTGLNAWLSYKWAYTNSRSIAYVAFETKPLDHSELEFIEDADWQKLLLAKWEEPTSFGPFKLTKVADDLCAHSWEKDSFDLIFHDAFSPDAQPELWSSSLLSQMFYSLCPGGIWVSYSAKGQVRRNLQSVGFEVERIPGPPGKREMLRARKP